MPAPRSDSAAATPSDPSRRRLDVDADLAVAETYDTNVSLFGAGHTGATEDYIASVHPGRRPALLAAHVNGGHGLLGDLPRLPEVRGLNRWDQRARSSCASSRRRGSTWSGHATARSCPRPT